MKLKKQLSICVCGLLLFPLFSYSQVSERWNLQKCIDYALEHNIQIKKSRVAQETASITTKQSQSALFPTISGDVSQGLTYRPFQKQAGNYVNGSIASSSSNKLSQSGSYGINAQWTVWDGGQSRQTIKSNQIAEQIAGLSTQQTANNIQEQIAQLYIQILYTEEALKVNTTLLKNDEKLWQRGQELMQNGKMAKADVAQLEAQVQSGRYDIVNAKTQIASYKLQLKQLLELSGTDELEIDTTVNVDESLLSNIPDKATVYEAALENRPEIKGGKLAIEQSNLSMKIAKAAYTPTISMTAGIGDSHMTGIQTAFGSQMRDNFNGAVGVSVSIPILDNRKRKSTVEKAKVNQLSTQLDLQDYQKTLYNSIETYWINAVNSKEKYVAAKSNAASMNTSYELVDEQFKVGIKNIAELLTARTKVLTAEQEKLQARYTALLNITLLKFYQGEKLTF